jgi:endoglucanase
MEHKTYYCRGVARRFATFGLGFLLAAMLLGVSGGTVSAQSQSSAAGAGYWRTSGNKILDANGQAVLMTGVAWFGMETNTFAPHGLWIRSYKSILEQIRDLGYNTLRLPYSNKLFEANSTPNGIDFSKNPDLQGLNGLQILDKIIGYAGKLGLRIILDRHILAPGYETYDLWYDAAYPEQRWLTDWQMLARRYMYNTAVIGADLHNEPHGRVCWGCGDTATDWRLAAERAGNAIHSVNPHWLIFVSGIGQETWWGGDLRGVRANPVRLNTPNKVVYSAHEYGPSLFCQPYFYNAAFPANLPAHFDNFWGYIHKENIAPVWIGETGTDLATRDTTPCQQNNKPADAEWFPVFLNYLKQNNIGWNFWSINPNTLLGGLIASNDTWQGIHQAKQNYLQPLQFRLSMPTTLLVVDPNNANNTATNGTLAWALANSAGTQQIQFSLSPTQRTLRINGALPPLAPGATLKGDCANRVVLDGTGVNATGLQLGGRNIIEGIHIKGFLGKAMVTTSPGNRLICTRVG